MTDESVHVVNKPAFSESVQVVNKSAFSESVQVVNKSAFSEVKAPTMEHLPVNSTSYFQHQIDLLRQELGKNVIPNNDFKNFINKKLADETVHKNDAVEILHDKIRVLEKENQCL